MGINKLTLEDEVARLLPECEALEDGLTQRERDLYIALHGLADIVWQAENIVIQMPANTPECIKLRDAVLEGLSMNREIDQQS